MMEPSIRVPQHRVEHLNILYMHFTKNRKKGHQFAFKGLTLFKIKLALVIVAIYIVSNKLQITQIQ